MILANPKTLEWTQRTGPARALGKHWQIVTRDWLQDTEQAIRDSERWDKPGDKNNELLGRSILWFYQVRDAFDEETKAAETDGDQAGEVDSETWFPLAGPGSEPAEGSRR